MTMIGTLLCAAFLVISLAATGTAEFLVYPGAQRDQQLEQMVKKDPHNQGVESEVYLTPDPFQKVYEFYKAIGAEDETMKKLPPPKLPNGAPVQWAFFIFDGAKSISSSKFWMKIQRPTVADLAFKDIRDVTSIQVARKT